MKSPIIFFARTIIVLLTVLLFPAASFGQIFVDADATAGANNGTSWADAFVSLQDALAAATSGDQIWVADGVYTPVTPADPNNVTQVEREATFQLIDGVEIYGGFDGTETTLDQRDVEANPAILSGDIDGDDTAVIITDPETEIQGDNSFNVVTGSGTDGTARLDGFTITAGLANGSSLNGAGGGMVNDGGSPTLANLTFAGNSTPVFAGSGGGMANISSSPTLTNVTFAGNSCDNDGGGMFNGDNSSPVLTNVVFSGNSSTGSGGGGMYNDNNSSPVLTNVSFSGNSAHAGGGMLNDSSSPTLTNVIFSGNSALNGPGGGMGNNNSNPVLTNVTFAGNSANGSGGGMGNGNSSSPTLTNVIIWGNTAVTGGNEIFNDGTSSATLDFCLYRDRDAESDIVEGGGFTATNSLTGDPRFVDAADPDGADDIFGTPDDGLALQNTSPAINTGSNQAYTDAGGDLNNDPDLAGEPRLQHGTIDMGAYEWEWEGGAAIFVDTDATGDNNGTDWTNAYTDLQDGLQTAGVIGPDVEIWVAEGVYYPDEGVDQTDNDRTATFQLINGVEIYGGFAGVEATLGERDPEANPTILSGDIDHETNPDDTDNGVVTDSEGINGDNSYTVATGSGTDATARLDGFIITGGDANGSGVISTSTGGGMFNFGGSPTLTNLTFSGNSASDWGGGIVNTQSSSPTLVNVTFSGNSTAGNGGGMRNEIGSSPTLVNVTFSGNSASGSGGGMFNDSGSDPALTGVTFTGNSAVTNGGGMWNGDSSPVLTGVTFSGNTAGNLGGGMFNRLGSNPTLTNVTFSGNSASIGGGMLNNNSSPTLTNVTFSDNSAVNNGGGMYNFNGSSPTLANVIIWGNEADGSTTTASASIFNDSSVPVISFSLIANSGGSGAGWLAVIGADGGNNIDADPLFVDSTDPDGADDTFGTPDDGLALQNTSPAVNAGSNDAYEAADGDPGNNSLQNDSDLAGEPRVFDGSPIEDIIDMGAYEVQSEPSPVITLTVDEGWRMLSSPIDGLSYDGVLGGLWTQGMDGSDYPPADFPNVYNWDLTFPDTCLENEECPGWVPPASLADPIPAGAGFIIFVFSDDNFDGTDEGFPKTITLSGSTHAGDVSPTINANGDGWTLVGNPYARPIDFASLSRTQVNDAAYVYDANRACVDAECGPDNDNRGGWRTTVGALYGDLTDGIIAPGQGFFVQTVSSPAGTPELTFSESAQLNDGPFYGKEKELAHRSLGEGGLRDFVRLEIQGESLYNSAWIRFSENGSTERTEGEALELQPLSQEYALLGARKTGGVLMDIAHYPLDAQELEIPLAVEATQSGEFTIRATDLALPGGMKLYLHDRQTGESMLLREDFEYSFKLDEDEVARKSPLERGKALDNSEADCAERGVCSQPLTLAQSSDHFKRSDGSEADRFLITTTPGAPAGELPEEVALGQNYPNPFNPTTVIRYQLPAVSQVRLDVYDMLGRRVVTLVDGSVEAGTHQVSFDAGRLSSGVYLYRLTANDPNGANQVFTKKLTLIK